MDKKISSFPPVLPNVPKVLILGSIPGGVSLEKRQYYGNPRNHFWAILYELFDQEPLDDYKDKLDFVKKHGIALWDSIGICYREGSLDANILEEEPNDIAGLLKEQATIKLIACNGGKSHQTLRNNFPVANLGVEVVKMPSTSPIPGKYTKSFEEKVAIWRKILTVIS
ncbi:TDG/mug DNA glycosylase family protein [Virgibacillus natechei]|uniref:TDG/mug DNA glycosylase family protein n=1 Tax=Virgibacillus natechei TaxID=1216297 RepID=A0ABS4IGP5_9BACI|nr:DNA-deoxyinosine glycosylase [Virgibacillus natechei]MBP1970123.1 TDG/mug DNA glycosylase family protein [Virgibacillus natechei]UZD14199.1 DNA-deoxyinosine glycosylase [Virgibacillus natechei]